MVQNYWNDFENNLIGVVDRILPLVELTNKSVTNNPPSADFYYYYYPPSSGIASSVWDNWNGDVMPTLDAALFCSSRVGSDPVRESGLGLGSIRVPLSQVEFHASPKAR